MSRLRANQYQMVARAIARCMARAVNTREELAIVAVATELCVEFALLDPGFDRLRFLESCGIDN